MAPNGAHIPELLYEGIPPAAIPLHPSDNTIASIGNIIALQMNATTHLLLYLGNGEVLNNYFYATIVREILGID